MLGSRVEYAVNRERRSVPLAEAGLRDLAGLRRSVSPEEQVIEGFTFRAALSQGFEIEHLRSVK